MDYPVYLQVKRTGRTHAHVPALDGCNWTAAAPEEAWQRAPHAIAAHLAWLRSHGEAVPPEDEPVVPVLAERNRSTAPSGNLVGFFPSDQQPVTRGEAEHFLHLMACSRADLLALTQGLPEETLRYVPAPGSWSIYEILRHVAAAEQYYLAHLCLCTGGSLPRFKPAKTVWERLARVRTAAVERLSALGDEERSARIVADSSTEQWTVRKVFRRFVEHEREHYDHVLQVLQAHARSQ